jgi:23S rRNA (cytidine1920-2'-O)/16S rRNA (cytidine1409-2'-O)-methyltransferase
MTRNIRLDVFISRRFGMSRERAKSFIENGKAIVNNKIITKPAFLISTTDKVFLDAGEDFVSRGGYKLQKALSEFNIDVYGAVCLDVGAAKGGFSDCLLKRGAKLVYACDVGTAQLDERLKRDERVVSFENSDIRDLELNEKVDFASVDVSFISITKVIYFVKRHLRPGGALVGLIKPQYETGAGFKGAVKNKKLHKRILSSVLNEFETFGLYCAGLTYSPIKGKSGNIEYLAALCQEKPSGPKFILDEIIITAFLEAK